MLAFFPHSERKIHLKSKINMNYCGWWWCNLKWKCQLSVWAYQFWHPNVCVCVRLFMSKHSNHWHKTITSSDFLKRILDIFSSCRPRRFKLQTRHTQRILAPIQQRIFFSHSLQCSSLDYYYSLTIHIKIYSLSLSLDLRLKHQKALCVDRLYIYAYIVFCYPFQIAPFDYLIFCYYTYSIKWIEMNF